jgi:hypothetical protein
MRWDLLLHLYILNLVLYKSAHVLILAHCSHMYLASCHTTTLINNNLEQWRSIMQYTIVEPAQSSSSSSLFSFDVVRQTTLEMLSSMYELKLLG